jgi:hypothetical protein
MVRSFHQDQGTMKKANIAVHPTLTRVTPLETAEEANPNSTPSLDFGNASE